MNCLLKAFIIAPTLIIVSMVLVWFKEIGVSCIYSAIFMTIAGVALAVAVEWIDRKSWRQ